MVENLRSILEELGYSNLIENAKEFRASPIYRESKNNTVLSIRKDSGKWIDYAIGKTGDLSDLVQISLGLKSAEDAAAWMQSKNIDVGKVANVPRQKITMPEIFDPECLLRLTNDTDYWEGRGIKPEVLKRFDGGLAYKGKMAGRYVFPIYNYKKDIVGFAGRDIFNNGSRPKWKLIGSKEKWVYPAFLNIELLRERKTVILVESIGDELALFNAGIENVLCAFGVNLSTGIINFLIKTDFNRIIVSLNNDAATGGFCGNEASQKMHDKLLSYFDASQLEVALPTKKDFGEMAPEEIIEWGRSHNCI